MRADKRRERKRGRLLQALGLSALAGVAIGAVLALRSGSLELTSGMVQRIAHDPRLALSGVDFVGLRTLDAASLWQRAGVAPGVGLLDLDLAAIEARIRSHPRVARVAAVRLPPGRLLVGVRERVPVAVDAQSGQGIDAEGERFPVAEPEARALPHVRGATGRALALIGVAALVGTEIVSVDAEADDQLSFRARDSEAVVRVGRDPLVSLVSFARIRHSGLAEGYGAREIDLRFPGSVVLRDLQKKRGE